MSQLQEQADAAARALMKAVGELAGPGDGEIAVILRASVDSSTPADGDLFYTWDWFWRPKTQKPPSRLPASGGAGGGPEGHLS